MNEISNVVVLTNKMEPASYDEKSRQDNSYLLVIFQTPMLFSYDGINYFKIPKNSVILYSPGAEKYYKSSGVAVLNSFMFFSTTIENISKYKIPLNTLFVIPTLDLEKIVFEMDRLSYVVNTPYAKSLVPNIPTYAEAVLRLLEESSNNLSAGLNTTQNIKSEFINIRTLMCNNPVEYTVDKMTKSVNFTETYFGIKYKEFFGISPSQDRKIQLVALFKKYLEETDYSLETIGDLCNIKSTAHLINLFKSVEHITPHQYRLKIRN